MLSLRSFKNGKYVAICYMHSYNIYVEWFAKSMNVALFCQYVRNLLLVCQFNKLHWQEHVRWLIICTWSSRCKYVFVLRRSPPKLEPVFWLIYAILLLLIFVFSVEMILQNKLFSFIFSLFSFNRFFGLWSLVNCTSDWCAVISEGSGWGCISEYGEGIMSSCYEQSFPTNLTGVSSNDSCRQVIALCC